MLKEILGQRFLLCGGQIGDGRGFHVPIGKVGVGIHRSPCKGVIHRKILGGNRPVAVGPGGSHGEGIFSVGKGEMGNVKHQLGSAVFRHRLFGKLTGSRRASLGGDHKNAAHGNIQGAGVVQHAFDLPLTVSVGRGRQRQEGSGVIGLFGGIALLRRLDGACGEDQQKRRHQKQSKK